MLESLLYQRIHITLEIFTSITDMRYVCLYNEGRAKADKAETPRRLDAAEIIPLPRKLSLELA
jgi:hypothetical protein